MSEPPATDNEVFNHYWIGMTTAEIAEHLMDSCPEFHDLNVKELLLLQESAFQYIHNNNGKKDTNSSHCETSGGSSILENENVLSRKASMLSLDEALARALDLGDDFNSLSVNEDAVTPVDNRRSTLRATPSSGGSRIVRQDDIDPDTMTYEELQSLGESLGSHSRGLSADLISRLPTFRYKSGLFSKKNKAKEEYDFCKPKFSYFVCGAKGKCQ